MLMHEMYDRLGSFPLHSFWDQEHNRFREIVELIVLCSCDGTVNDE